MAKTDDADTAPFRARDYLAPRHWPTWLGLGLLRLLVQLPIAGQARLARGLGNLTWALLPGRRHIARVNIRTAFPELDRAEQRRLERGAFHAGAMALFETGLSWWAPDARLRDRYRIEGLENLEAARQQGKGVVLLGGHYTTLEISGRLLAFHVPDLQPIYKRAKNPLFEAVMAHSRRRRFDGLLLNKDMRAIVRSLRKGKVVWYAPDQDFGRKRSVFAPFMGVQTATLTMTSRLAKVSGAPFVPLYSERTPDMTGWVLRLAPALEGFPTGDDEQDAAIVNATIEEQVRRTPDQYLWLHRRFRTRPPGEPRLY